MAVSYIDIGALFLPVLLGLMVVKFFMVVLYFMHIKFDNKLFGRLFYIGLGLAVFVYVGSAVDVPVLRRLIPAPRDRRRRRMTGRVDYWVLGL